MFDNLQPCWPILRIESLPWTFQLQVMPEGLNPSSPPKDGVFIEGLHLYNALWDTTQGVLMSNEADSNSQQLMPAIWLKPADVSSPTFRKGISYEFHPCQVFCSSDLKEHGDEHVVACIPLPTIESPNVWHQARVFMTSDI